MPLKSAFETYLYSENLEGSKKAGSYLTALNRNPPEPLLPDRARPAGREPRQPHHRLGRRPENPDGPRNGLCLSATYDAAFDRKLITFDEDYRLVLSRTIREHVPSASLREYFLSKAGQRIELPGRFLPLQPYLAAHRESGEF